MKKQNFFKVLRIISSVICAALVAACVFVFIFVGSLEGFLTIMAAAVFMLLMLVFKFLQEDAEKYGANTAKDGSGSPTGKPTGNEDTAGKDDAEGVAEGNEEANPEDVDEQ